MIIGLINRFALHRNRMAITRTNGGQNRTIPPLLAARASDRPISPNREMRKPIDSLTRL